MDDNPTATNTGESAQGPAEQARSSAAEAAPEGHSHSDSAPSGPPPQSAEGQRHSGGPRYGRSRGMRGRRPIRGRNPRHFPRRGPSPPRPEQSGQPQPPQGEQVRRFDEESERSSDEREFGRDQTDETQQPEYKEPSEFPPSSDPGEQVGEPVDETSLREPEDREFREPREDQGEEPGAAPQSSEAREQTQQPAYERGERREYREQGRRDRDRDRDRDRGHDRRQPQHAHSQSRHPGYREIRAQIDRLRHTLEGVLRDMEKVVEHLGKAEQERTLSEDEIENLRQQIKRLHR